MKYRIYRLKDTEENVYKRFSGSEYLQRREQWPPKPEDYEMIWEDTYLDHPAERVLEAVYSKFNLAHPAGFNHHSMSVGDIVVLIGEQDVAYFCDSVGWAELPDFFESVNK